MPARFRRFLIPSVLLLCAVPASAAWQAGVARADITPTEPIWLAGYGSRTHPSEGVRQHIFVKALALKDEQGAITVLVTSDLVGFPREVSDPIAARIQKRFGLPRERVVLNSSHTHSAPVIGYTLLPAYPPEKVDMTVVRRYTAKLEDQTVDAVGRAIRDLAPATISFEEGFAGVAVNRRRVGHREYPGPVDQDVPVLAVRKADGSLKAIVFGYACHNTVLADYLVNGDWAGYAQADLEAAHPGAIALFVQDCGADANPLPRRSVALAEMYGKILAAATDDVIKAKMRPVEGPIHAVYAHVDVPFQTPPSRAELEARVKNGDQYSRRHAAMMLKILDRDGKLPDHYPYPVEVWQFGKDLTFIALGGEVVSEYSLRYKHRYGPNNVWVAGYSNDVFAYIPTLRILHEGGYEGGGAMIALGQPAPFGWGVEEMISEKVDELVQQARKE